MSISWYSIIITMEDGGYPIFNGYFSVDELSNFVTGFYSYTGIGTNILVPTGTGAYMGNEEGFNWYEYNNFNYDNAYLSSWLQFDKHGVLVKNLPGFQNSYVGLFCNIINGPQTTNRNGVISYNNNENYILANFYIESILSPPSDLPCFKEDTLILTIDGYKKIQDLRKGDLIKTAQNNYKPIDMIGKSEISHNALQERIVDQLYQCSQSEYPEIFEPLIITGCHSILVDDFVDKKQKEKTIEVNQNIYITDNKYRLPACADYRTTVYEIPGTYTIYHLALEHDDYYMNYGIYANGLLVETCSKRFLKELSNMTLIE